MEKSLEELQKQRKTLVDALEKEENNKKSDARIAIGSILTVLFTILAFVQTGAFLVAAGLACLLWVPKVHKRRKLRTSIALFDEYFKKVEEEKKKDQEKKKEKEDGKKEEKKEGEKENSKEEKAPTFKRTKSGLLVDEKGNYYTPNGEPVVEFKPYKVSKKDLDSVSEIKVSVKEEKKEGSEPESEK